ncbi:DUF4344 domain-containing metallopeptidase [Anianabacter salinae]|uniref:DUF4344 domain-containing metallopeptidase n=1 Tax=Anianabacter salinae TaxID=2851023 RepID=UPI00225DDAB3|nr:DUF4344 domain-containing metallopeptidase [Anianabacter salinae]MBV0913017.1 DUF4344 domain-containing metallopeptidase [Anianabacter salinae]
MFKSLFFVAMLIAAANAPRDAEEESLPPEIEAFITSNLISVLYHELGHAVIDLENLPIFGQEEDAADVLSTLLVHDLFTEDSAVSITYHAAEAYLGEDKANEQDGGEEAFWDVHGSNKQRYFNMICLFYGANPDERDDVADDLGLPERRAETCPEEFDLANASWGPVLDRMRARGPGDTLRFVDNAGADVFSRLTARVIEKEVADLNADLSFESPVVVRVEACGTANAFYDPSDSSIIMCTEFTEYYAAIRNE